MKISDVFPSKYVRAAELGDRQVTLVIAKVVTEDIGDDVKPVIYFQGTKKGLVLNKTNANNISAVYGDETSGWVGNPIVLYPTQVDFQGRSVEAIRVKIPKASRKAAVVTQENGDDQPRRNDEDLDDEIPF